MKTLALIFALLWSLSSYAQDKKESPTGINVFPQPLYIIDGMKVPRDSDAGLKVKSDNIQAIRVLKNEEAINQYGDAGKNGVIIITTKEGIKKENAAQVAMKKSSPLFIVDDVELVRSGSEGSLPDIKATDIHSMYVYKDEEALSKYREAGKNGVIVITTKAKKPAVRE